MIKWVKTAERRPTDELGAQVDVLFSSPKWGWSLLGMYTHWPDDEVAKGACRWAMYDQINDKFYDAIGPAEEEPEFWMIKPELPKP